ncbi:hypothetical protein BRADI_1g34533v3 [Brachypodium distachyon]|uniref:F-box domain-containing protein n=1 Tax=Brachypodium distachyon TaxID=15368 RepID=A0A2K2DMP3_BRADI|nr:hypothetical protein BRADI_1g34533v3 [Brachypodium distachyon]
MELKGSCRPATRLGPCLGLGLEPTGRHDTAQGPDLISNLPNGVLRHIISLLPTKDGARTQSLSTQWGHLFRSAPLNLEVELRREDEPAPSSLVSRILADHQAPCRRLSLTWYGYKSDYVTPFLNGWLQSPALNDLRELDLWQNRKESGRERWVVPREDPHTLPPSVLRFSPTLRILSINSTGVVISEGYLHSILAGCPVIDSLVLSELDGVRGVRINSSTLRRLGVSSGFVHGPEEVLQQVIIEDAPLLEKLFLSGLDSDLSISLVCAPKLDFLGSLPEGFTKVKLETTVLQRIVAVSLKSVVSTVKVLVLRMSPASVDDAIDYATLFPCLEKLYVLLYRVGASKRARHHFPLDHTECFELHLKKIVLMNYQGTPRDLYFARFFLLNAKVLEHMLDKRASEGAQFDFVVDSYFGDDIHIGHIHDLTAADPFDSSLC